MFFKLNKQYADELRNRLLSLSGPNKRFMSVPIAAVVGWSVFSVAGTYWLYLCVFVKWHSRYCFYMIYTILSFLQATHINIYQNN